MAAASRTFKLRLSPAGMDLLIEAHCRLIRATRRLLPWGTTLHVAMVHLDTLGPEEIALGLECVRTARLCGAQVHFLGAPASLNDVAARIVARVVAAPAAPVPTLLQIYLLALHTARGADPRALRRAERQLARGAGRGQSSG